MSKHTPGPWEATANIEHGSYGPSWTIRLDRQNVIASVSGAALHRGPEQSEANARLIAAAPKMLDALKTIRNQSIGEDWTAAQAIEWAKQFAREIMAEAEGRE